MTRIIKTRYIFAHGKSPRGQGTWMFETKDYSQSFWYSGKFSEACKAAKKALKGLGCIYVASWYLLTTKNFMTMTDLLRALLIRGGDYQLAKEIIEEMISSCEDGQDPEEVLYEYGLEPDYVFDLLDYWSGDQPISMNPKKRVS